MLQILQKGLNINPPLNTTGFTGDYAIDSALASVVAIKSGRLATITPVGVALADAAQGNHLVGFVINDAAGYFYENKPALASGIVPLSSGPQVVITDQILTTDSFVEGDLLYIGSGANAGLVTKVLPTAGNVAPFGVAMSSASAAAPELQIYVF